MRRLFHFLGLLALLAYVANGAQAHLRVLPGETIAIPVCGDGLSRTIEMTVGGGHEDTSDLTCCGDCLVPFALPAAAPVLPVRTVEPRGPRTASVYFSVYPRSPLWPGAPPQGPPALA